MRIFKPNKLDFCGLCAQVLKKYLFVFIVFYMNTETNLFSF